jgi:hypothetical protein
MSTWCALSKPTAVSTQAGPLGHVYKEQSGPSKPSKHSQVAVSARHLPLILQLFGQGRESDGVRFLHINRKKTTMRELEKSSDADEDSVEYRLVDIRI